VGSVEYRCAQYGCAAVWCVVGVGLAFAGASGLPEGGQRDGVQRQRQRQTRRVIRDNCHSADGLMAVRRRGGVARGDVNACRVRDTRRAAIAA